MFPAYSIIFFTTASGLGYGLLALIGTGAAFGLLPESRLIGLTGLSIALVLVTAGLLSSTFHLGHPERAWRALTQWRSSWLSREGVLALLTYIPACLLGLAWIKYGAVGGVWTLAGLFAAAGAVATIYATSKIYASLKAVPRWHNRLVPAVYLTLALMTGSIWFNALTCLLDRPRFSTIAFAGTCIVVAWLTKQRYWTSIDRAKVESTTGSATGLDRFGDVRLLDPPHTGANYLLKEMGYRIARKHALKLRRFATVFGFALPLVLILFTFFIAAEFAVVVAVLAAISTAVGTIIERWLFFAEAQHVVTLYY